MKRPQVSRLGSITFTDFLLFQNGPSSLQPSTAANQLWQIGVGIPKTWSTSIPLLILLVNQILYRFSSRLSIHFLRGQHFYTVFSTKSNHFIFCLNRTFSTCIKFTKIANIVSLTLTKCQSILQHYFWQLHETVKSLRLFRKTRQKREKGDLNAPYKLQGSWKGAGLRKGGGLASKWMRVLLAAAEPHSLKTWCWISPLFAFVSCRYLM